jgi:predicted kinase
MCTRDRRHANGRPRSTVIEVQRLILLNGPPSSGKSTLARRWVLGHPLALNLDIDVVWGLIGGRADAVDESGVAACNLAIAMATTHLAGGHDVIVPQFLSREQFIVELESAARATGAQFIEIALIVDRAQTLRAFAARSAAPETVEHVTARELLERSGGVERLSDMHDSYMRMLAARPHAHRIDVVQGDVDSTFALLDAIVANS